ncbi:hypothetical protein [Thermococcus stetteri]|uniref:hypothetical protein n=1 Tax=Thermococcus stetteri TaxID=49900 RepID=UPI001FD7CEEF|nr:hypothetical protein [Thermococcus stetteri]MBP1911461.1 hypothetical protein [Thermococcus stetteri]
MRNLESYPKLSNEETRRELEKVIASGKTSELTELALKKPEVIFELERKLEEGDKFDKMDALWALSKLAERLDSTKALILEPAVEPLMKISSSKNRWMRRRAAKTLATLASKAPYGDEIVGRFLEWYLSDGEDKAVPSLEFFSYYFLKTWDEKTAEIVLSRLDEFIQEEETSFDALMTLEAVITSIPPEKAEILRNYVPLLERLKETAPPEVQKLTIRILDEMALKLKALFSRRDALSLQRRSPCL